MSASSDPEMLSITVRGAPSVSDFVQSLQRGPGQNPPVTPGRATKLAFLITMLLGFLWSTVSWVYPASLQSIAQRGLGWQEAGHEQWPKAESAPPIAARPSSSQIDTPQQPLCCLERVHYLCGFVWGHRARSTCTQQVVSSLRLSDGQGDDGWTACRKLKPLPRIQSSCCGDASRRKRRGWGGELPGAGRVAQAKRTPALCSAMTRSLPQAFRRQWKIRLGNPSPSR